MFKYFEILRKTLSGTMEKNLLSLEFPLKAEEEGGAQEFLYRLKESKLKDDELLDQFYDRVIESYEYVGNYLILIIHDVYDVPGKTSDGIENDDASDEIYEYIMVSICPVNLSKPGLSYNAEENSFQNRIRDWVVAPPEKGFLFPAFNDRSTDLHSVLYYTKDANDLKEDFVTLMLDCPLPLAAASQKDTFHAIIEETLEETCTIESVISIHEKLTEMIDEHKEDPAPLILDKEEVKGVLANSGVANEKLENFDRLYDAAAGSQTSLVATNVISTKTFEVKTPDVVIKVSPDRLDLIETKEIDGRKCLVIDLGSSVEVNGISVRTSLDEYDE